MLRRFSPLLSNVEVTHNAPAPRFAPDTSTNHLSAQFVEEPYIFHLSAYSRRKNPENLLKGYAASTQQHDLVIGGGGWEHMHDRVSELGIEDKVHFLGYVPNEHLPQLYTNAELFLFPSYHECFGLPPLESMACGTPPVVSDAYSLPEVVDDAGFYCQPNDHTSIADAIDRAVENTQTKKPIQRAATFTWESTATQLIKIYTRLCH
ncbi:glycosyltransferase family 4 protein [Natronoarchaeum sp. GCM10025703]